MRLKVENFNLLSELGVDLSIVSQYQILCLPENIENQSEHSDLIDSGESITLSKLLKEKGVKCANSYDLGLDSKISEQRSIDLWLGSIWILDHAALPLFISVVGRLVGEKIQRKLETSKQLKASHKVDDSEPTKVHANLKIVDGKLSAAEIKYHGNADTFLKILKGINDDQYSSGN